MRNAVLLLSAFVLLAAAAPGAEPLLVPVRIDGPVHDPANHTFWYGPFCECCSVADFDGDGDMDIAAGRNWYEAPDWKKHADFRDGAETNGPETDDNSEFTMDVNRDGRPDVVSSGWMRMKGAFWYENPGPEGLKKGVKWKATRIHAAQNMEGVIHGDIDGDGDDDILCNHWAPVEGQGMTWIEHVDRQPWLVEHVVGTEGEHHGNGLGDVNGDGRCDIVTPKGWYEAPPKPAEGKWTFHADYLVHRVGEPQQYIPASHPMLVYDCNGDGLNDIIVGASHEYGLAWLEQKLDGDKRTFQTHWIETDFGQFHTMVMGDLNGDGKPDLVTGKRLFAHHGRDTSCYEPMFAFWYEVNGGKFDRHILAFNHLPKLEDDETKRNPAPNFVPAVGMKLVIADMDADKDNDVVICGKGGLYIFYNQGFAPQPRPKHRLPPEDTYPSWVPWYQRGN